MGEAAGPNSVRQNLPGMGHLGAGEHNGNSLTGVQEPRPVHRLVSALHIMPVASVLNKTKTERKRGYTVRSSWGTSYIRHARKGREQQSSTLDRRGSVLQAPLSCRIIPEQGTAAAPLSSWSVARSRNEASVGSWPQ